MADESSEPGSTFECSLDSAAFAACSSPQSYSSLSDGTHDFEVQATDGAGNTDPTPASSSFTVDTKVRGSASASKKQKQKGKKAKAKLTVKLTDEAGNKKTTKLSVKLKR